MADIYVVLGILNGEVMECQPAATYEAAVVAAAGIQEGILQAASENDDDDFDAMANELANDMGDATKKGKLPYAQFEDPFIAEWVWEIYKRKLQTRT